MPYGTVGGADIVDLDTGKFLQGHLYGCAVFADDVRVVACHLEPELVAVHLFVNVGTVECAEAAEGIAAEEGSAAEGHHGLWPVYHGGEHEL